MGCLSRAHCAVMKRGELAHALCRALAGAPCFATELLSNCNQRPFGCNCNANKYIYIHIVTKIKPFADCNTQGDSSPGLQSRSALGSQRAALVAPTLCMDPSPQFPQQDLDLASRPRLRPLHMQPMHAPYVHESRTWAASRKLMKSKRSQRRRCRSSYSVKSSSGTRASWASMFSSIPGH